MSQRDGLDAPPPLIPGAGTPQCGTAALAAPNKFGSTSVLIRGRRRRHGSCGRGGPARWRARGPAQTFRGAVPWAEGTADVRQRVRIGIRVFCTSGGGLHRGGGRATDPSDPIGPGAVAAGVPFFLDRQLAGKFGRGDHFYLVGPWAKGTPDRVIKAASIPRKCIVRGWPPSTTTSARISRAPRSAHSRPRARQLLKGLEGGTIELDGGVDSKTFFAMLLQNTKEGYFADPIYGGNKEMGAWKMIGFPGAHYDYREWAPRHGERVPFRRSDSKGAPVGPKASHDDPETGRRRACRFGWTGAIMGQQLCDAGLRSSPWSAVPGVTRRRISRRASRKTNCVTCGVTTCFRTSHTIR